MELQLKKAVLTGGSGPIGLALIRKLLKENIEILLLQRENSVRRIYLPDDERLHIKYCELDQLKNFMYEEQDFDVFFHLGWTNKGRAMRENLEEQNKNISYSCDAVELAHRLGCHSFIGAGSQAEYGRCMEALSAHTVCTPESAYGVAKLCAGHETRILCQRYGIRHIWTRILSGYGIYDNMDSVLISPILNSMKGKKLEFSKGEQIWDFIYLDDLANALYLIAKKGKPNAIYPIGSGEARPLKEYIEILCSKLGKLDEMELGKIPYSKTQVMHLEADIELLQEDTGWKPEVKFEDGIDEVIDFYKYWKAEWETKYQERLKEVTGNERMEIGKV